MKFNYSTTLLLLLSFMTGLQSCSEKNLVSKTYTRNTPSESKTIPLEMALESMNELLSELGMTTKASDDDYSVEVFGDVHLKSQDTFLPDTSLYIVNFADDAGFAVLAAQSKIKTKIFCITEAGALKPSDIHDAISLLEYNSVSTKSTEADDDQWTDLGKQTIPLILASSMINQLTDSYDYGQETIATKGSAEPDYEGTPNTLAMLETKWNQKAPFNNFRTDGAPVGCVATATAQIIEFNAIKHGYTSFVEDNNKTFDWTLLSTVYNAARPSYEGSDEAQKEASAFLQYVGLKKNCNISYSTSGSSGYADGAKRTFKNMGYKSVKKYLGFENADLNRAIAQVSSGLPMYMDGTGSGTGHAWVLDGTFSRRVSTNGEYDRTENMFHINWGWNGDCDGYFEYGVFNTTQRITTEEGIDSGSRSESVKFTWNYRTITYSL